MFFLAVAAVGTLAAGIASVSGFGIGSLLTPVLATHYGMRAAVAAVSVPHLIATAFRFWRLRRHVDRHVLFGFGAINAAGSLAGAIIHVWVNNPVLSIVLGILLVFAGLTGVLGYAERIRFNKRMSWIAGVVSGGFGGLVGNQGGIRSAAMLGLGIQGPAFVATATAIGIVVDIARMPVYLATESPGMLQAWPAIAVGIAGVVLGTLLGERVLRRIPERLFRRVISAILLAIGVYLLATHARQDRAQFPDTSVTRGDRLYDRLIGGQTRVEYRPGQSLPDGLVRVHVPGSLESTIARDPLFAGHRVL